MTANRRAREDVESSPTNLRCRGGIHSRPCRTGVATIAIAVAVVACDSDFTPYNEIDRLRILAISADDPYLKPNQVTTLRALVVNPKNLPLSYQWKWCPFTAGADVGWECAISHEELQGMVDEAVGPGIIAVPPYELSRTSTAPFMHPLDPLFLQGVCAGIQSGEVPDFVNLPDCSERFPITIRIEVTGGDETIEGVKDIQLLYTDTPDEPNRNPVLDGLDAIFEEPCGDRCTQQTVTRLEEDGSTELKRGVEYRLRVLLDEAIAEGRTKREEVGPEVIVITWFIESGEMDRTRTSYVDGTIEWERARENYWKTPKKVDYEETSTNLYLVVRDDRDGVSWMTRQVQLEEK